MLFVYRITADMGLLQISSAECKSSWRLEQICIWYAYFAGQHPIQLLQHVRHVREYCSFALRQGDGYALNEGAVPVEALYLSYKSGLVLKGKLNSCNAQQNVALT